MDPIGESEILRHLHKAGVDSHLAPHPNTPEWDLTVGNHVANDALRPQSGRLRRLLRAILQL